MTIGADMVDEKLASILKKISALSAGLVLLCCFCISAGWFFDIAELRTPIPGGGIVSFGTCVAFALLNCFILTTMACSGRKPVAWICYSGAALLALLAAVRALETALGADWIPPLEIPVPADRNSLMLPGPVTVDVCILLIFYGLGFALSRWKFRVKEWPIFQALTLCGCVISFIPIIGYISGQESLCTIYGCIKQPLAITFISLLSAFPILFRDVSDSPLADAARNNRTGRVFRTGLLLSLVACPLAFVLKTALVLTQIIEPGLASTLSLTALLVIAVRLLWSSGTSGADSQTTQLQEFNGYSGSSGSGNIPPSPPQGVASEGNRQSSSAWGSGQVISKISPPDGGQRINGNGVASPINDRQVQVASGANNQPVFDSTPYSGLGEATTIVGEFAAPVSARASSVILMCNACKNRYTENLEVCPIDGNELRVEIVDRLIGTIFAEKYRIDALLGKGGMSTVYLAKHTLMGKQVAIKLLHSNILSNIAAVRRFQHEAKTMSRLRHPNILDALDFGFFDGLPYLVMNLVEGSSLSELLKETRTLSLRQFFDISLQICSGLSHAHTQGIVHRDLKPANIMIIPEQSGDKVMIVDFGLAKFTSAENEGADRITQTGDCMGSPLYMSPEQCTSSPVDHRTDIYSLGCLFYECLTGNPPIRGNSILEVMQGHLSGAPAAFPPSTNVPHDLQELIYGMLAKDPQDRPQSLSQIHSKLKVAQTHASVAEF